MNSFSVRKSKLEIKTILTNSDRNRNKKFKDFDWSKKYLRSGAPSCGEMNEPE